MMGVTDVKTYDHRLSELGYNPMFAEPTDLGNVLNWIDTLDESQRAAATVVFHMMSNYYARKLQHVSKQ